MMPPRRRTLSGFARLTGLVGWMVFAAFKGNAQDTPPYKNPAMPLEARVNDLIIRMTPEEKFWQLFMLAESWELPKERYKDGIFGFEGGVSEGNGDGKLIAVDRGGSAPGLVQKINKAQRFFMEQTRLGIPMIPFGEALHGLVRDGATAFPQSIALAATFDTALMHRVSRAIAAETRACGIRMVLSPVVNIADDPRWGRTEETYGEDPWLSSAMGVAFVAEFEKAGIITNPKHFVANAGAGGRDSYPVHYTERMLDEIYFPPFKACIQQGGSQSVMAAYNSLDGTPCTANTWLLNTKLKKDWNFDGFVISDAGATGGSNCLHMTAKDYYESTVLAMNNGLDVIFQTDYSHYKLFQPPFLDGSIRKDAIDEALRRVLRAKFRLGLFEKPYADTLAASTCFGKPAHLDLAREAAQKAVVLLKNQGNVLPFSKDIRSIAVIGRDAEEGRLGGYSGSGFRVVSLLEGIRKKMEGRSEVRREKGCERESESESESEKGRIEGVKGAYYNNVALEGEPVLVRDDKDIDFRWTLYSPDPKVNYDWFSVRWTGELVLPENGAYEIGIEGNDGYRLYVDGKCLIDNWVKGSYGRLLLPFHYEKAKKYPVKIEFFESSGSVRFRFICRKAGPDPQEEAIRKAVETARRCDAIVVAAGIEEGEGLDRAFLNLPGRQEEMILKLAALKKPMVVLLYGGSAIVMNRWIDSVPGVIMCWYPGEQGGNAVTDVLFGDVNPAGRLPITFPMTEGQLPLTYNHKPTGRNDDYADITGEARFPFGYGLSYTSFAYSDLWFDKDSIKAGASTTVHVKITNTGKIAGEEVVQLYIKDVYASVARPMKELKGCKRIFLKPDESRELQFTLSPEMFTMLDVNMKPVIEPGEFRVLVGASSKDIRLRGVIKIVAD